MTSRQLSESTSDELTGHGIYTSGRADDNLFFATRDETDLRNRLRRPMPAEAAETARERVAAARRRWIAAREGVIRAGLANRSAVLAHNFPTDSAPRNESLAHFDILHRQQMLGAWPDHINNEMIQARIDAPAKAVEQHRNSMLGEWKTSMRGPPRIGGKLSKRRFKKNKTKTKRRRQKFAKRVQGTKRRK